MIQAEDNWLLSQCSTKKEQTEESGSMGSRSFQQKGHLAIEGLSSNTKVDPHLSLDGGRREKLTSSKISFLHGKDVGAAFKTHNC